MPATWTPHVLIAWGGSLGAPPLDVWTNTLKALPLDGDVPTTITQAEQDELLGELAPIISAWVSQTAPVFTHSSGVKLEWLKANMIASTGKYMYPITALHEYDPVVTGGANTGTDWRKSLAVTLRTAQTRGRAHAGRFYPPLTPLNPETADTPYVASNAATSFAESALNMIGSINGITLASGVGFAVVNVSPGNSDIGLEPTYLGVDDTEVDRVLDTQRRRTNRVPRNAVSGSS